MNSRESSFIRQREDGTEYLSKLTTNYLTHLAFRLKANKGLMRWQKLTTGNPTAHPYRPLLASFSLPRARTPAEGVSAPTSAAGPAFWKTRLRQQPVCVSQQCVHVTVYACHTGSAHMSFLVQIKRRLLKGVLFARAALSSPTGSAASTVWSGRPLAPWGEGRPGTSLGYSCARREDRRTGCACA